MGTCSECGKTTPLCKDCNDTGWVTYIGSPRERCDCPGLVLFKTPEDVEAARLSLEEATKERLKKLAERNRRSLAESKNKILD